MAPSTNKGSSPGKRKRATPLEPGVNGSKQAAASKRQRYTPQACNECKKRKLKCSGGLVCSRCETAGVRCDYPAEYGTDPGQTVRSTFASMQSDIDALQTTVRQLQYDVDTLRERAAGHPAKPTEPLQEGFRAPAPRIPGPTSSAYNLDAANSSLLQIGVGSEDDEGHESPPMSKQGSPVPDASAQQADDPLSKFSAHEILRLVQYWEQEAGSVYPCINTSWFSEKLKAILTGTSSLMEALERFFDHKDLRLLKVILATSLVIEGEGESRFGKELMEHVETSASYCLRGINVSYNELQVLVVSTMYYFHADEEVVAWRTINLATRIALELGLHRRHGLFYHFPNPRDHNFPVRLFWCIYILDKRMSLGVGLPYALHDADIDDKLPTPETSAPYLESMVTYGRLLSKIWRSLVDAPHSHEGHNRRKDTDLESQIQAWENSVPEEFRLGKPPTSPILDASQSVSYRLQVLLRIRANQMRILVNRYHLNSTESIRKNLPTATRIVFIAQDTIRTLVEMNASSDIYRKQQNAFNYYLVSALSTILLAVCHMPSEFTHICRPEFSAALDMIKGLSRKSTVAQRLWKRVRRFRHVVARLLRNLSPPPKERMIDPDTWPTASSGSRESRSVHTDTVAAQQQEQQANQQNQNQPSRPSIPEDADLSFTSFWGPSLVDDLAGFDAQFGSLAEGESSDLMSFFETLLDGEAMPGDDNNAAVQSTETAETAETGGTTQIATTGQVSSSWLSETGGVSRMFGDLI